MYWNTFCGPGLGWWPLHGPLFMMVIGVIVIFSLSRIFAARKEVSVEASHDSAMDILRQRYANGEISEEDYLQRENLLRK